jgi:hypothetical protein
MSDDPRHVWVRDRLLETVSKWWKIGRQPVRLIELDLIDTF